MVIRFLALTLALQSAQTAQVPVSIEEYLKLKGLGAVRVSPAGGAVAFTMTEAVMEVNEYRTRLYIWRPGQGATVATNDARELDTPRWSKDGARLAFIAAGSRDGSAEDAIPQVWLLSTSSGGAATQLSNLPGGAVDFGWASDSSIYVLTRNKSQGVGEFWKIDVPGGAAEYAWGGDPGIREMAVSPDGRSIAFSAYAGASGDRPTYDLKLLNLETRRVRQLTNRRGSEVAPVWSPDGRTLVFQAPQNPDIVGTQTELFRVTAAGGTPQLLTGAFDRTIIAHDWPAGGDPIFTAALGAYTHLFALRETGAVEALTSGAFNYSSFDAAAPGAPVYAVRESAGEAQELWRVDGPRIDQLTNLNARTARWKLGGQEVVRWTAPDGLSVAGLLIYPADFEPGLRYPLLVSPYPGPSGRARDVVHQRHGFQLFAAQGYAVLIPNVRGSAGYGERFAVASRKDIAGGDFVDLMAGVEHVIGMGVADPSRLAIYGDGYGAYLTSWSIAQTPRFDAALSMYGVSDAKSESAQPAWREPELLSAAGFEGLEADLARSAVGLARNVQTPLLLIDSAGSSTSAAPAYQLYRALSDLGREVDYVTYPTEGRALGEPQQQVELFFRQLRWFDRYLKFGGADLFDFYLTHEWVPGRNGWRLRVTSVDTRAEYADTLPAAGRYLEVALTVQPDTAAVMDGTIRGLELDLGSAVRLVARDGTTRPAAGTVADFLGRRRLMTEAMATISVPLPQRGPPTGLILTLAFEIPEHAGEYRLLVNEFGPVRIWVPGPD